MSNTISLDYVNPYPVILELLSPQPLEPLDLRRTNSNNCTDFVNRPHRNRSVREENPYRPNVVACYALHVPLARHLPTASSMPHLAVIALAVRLTVPVIRVRTGLAHPSKYALPGAPIKKARHFWRAFLYFNLGDVLLSHTVTHAVPSALKGLTSVFGMGTGVSPSL